MRLGWSIEALESRASLGDISKSWFATARVLEQSCVPIEADSLHSYSNANIGGRWYPSGAKLHLNLA